MEISPTYWKKCSSCKQEIAYSKTYWTCSVSTCKQKRVYYVFCSVACWDSHVPVMNHKNAWAEEHQAPSFKNWKELQESLGLPINQDAKNNKTLPSKDGFDGKHANDNQSTQRRILVQTSSYSNPLNSKVASAKTEPMLEETDSSQDGDILIVASKLKNYIKNKSNMNTSAVVLEVLSDHIRKLCDIAIRNAQKEGRKTVLDRDFKVSK